MTVLLALPIAMFLWLAYEAWSESNAIGVVICLVVVFFLANIWAMAAA